MMLVQTYKILCLPPQYQYCNEGGPLHVELECMAMMGDSCYVIRANKTRSALTSFRSCESLMQTLAKDSLRDAEAIRSGRLVQTGRQHAARPSSIMGAEDVKSMFKAAKAQRGSGASLVCLRYWKA